MPKLAASFLSCLACAACLYICAEAQAAPAHLTPPGDAGPKDWTQEKWGKLSAYIGTYDYDAVLDDPNVSTELKSTTGTSYDELLQNLDVHAPVGYIDGALVLSGNQAHMGGEKEALLMVFTNGKIEVAIRNHDKIYLFSPTQKYIYLSPYMKSWVHEHSSDWRTYQTQPGNIIWNPAPPKEATP